VGSTTWRQLVPASWRSALRARWPNGLPTLVPSRWSASLGAGRSGGPGIEPLARIGDRQFVELAYLFLLQRAADPAGMEHMLALLRDSGSRAVVLAEIRASPEFRAVNPADPLEALHRSRTLWVQSLPPARRILDLGGSSQQSDRGALVEMGYPYDFEELVVVELPPDEAHPLYQRPKVSGSVDTHRGPVRYSYGSMSDLGGFEDGSIDLVVSGQTFEHVDRRTGVAMLAEAHRVLEPGGRLALDTPNRALTELELCGTGRDFINPDHEVEYHHAEMVEILHAAGFVIEARYGLNLMAASLDSGTFDAAEAVAHSGLYHRIEACYLLAYLATKPA
jgi:SAM-dependent methyltransferase